MNSFVTDNQMKQKAHDRYYYAIAKRDFIQGRKLKALIDKESLDDASTEQLAQLYQKVMAKSREYDYDSVSGRLSRKKPAPIKGEQKYNTEKTKTAASNRGGDQECSSMDGQVIGDSEDEQADDLSGDDQDSKDSSATDSEDVAMANQIEIEDWAVSSDEQGSW
ncbi:unnamed protein product [Phytophthora fragariaefolia]|uniref:Unnamed protein product n=1 Tax=Phytophthora fragariaefolia TaxID=1490495 RepID=A0A9W6XCJ9_9STRA|nr:unnamed protein product [Phytophthora fragariaefolia]